jgi:hypothetical protein
MESPASGALATALVASIPDPKAFRSATRLLGPGLARAFRARGMWISVVLRRLELEMRGNLLSIFDIN